MTLQTRSLGVMAFALLMGAATPVSAQWLSVFRDDFDGATLDLETWEVFTEGAVPGNNGSFEVNSGWLQLRSDPSGLPSIRSRLGSIPAAGDIKLRVGFRYVSTTSLGSRIALVSFGGSLPEYSPDVPPWFGVNRDCAGSSMFTSPGGLYQSCGPDVTPEFPFDDSPLQPHIAEFNYTTDGIEAWIDGEQVPASTGSFPRPNAIFFGWAFEGHDYTEFDIDFVELFVRDEPVPVHRTTWGAVKSVLR